MNCKKSKIYKKWRQTSIKHYFLATNFSKSKIYCEDCRRKFESRYHLKYHLSTTAPCRNPYIEPSKDRPYTSLQNMSDEVLYLISDFLLLKDLVSFIEALPRLLICHGMKTLWIERMDRRHPRFTSRKMYTSVHWLIANERKLLSIDHFIYTRSQGNDFDDNVNLEEYHRLFKRDARSRSRSSTCRHARIWYLQGYLNKWSRAMSRAINEPGPLKTSILF